MEEDGVMSEQKLGQDSVRPEVILLSVAEEILKLQTDVDMLRGAEGREGELKSLLEKLHTTNTELSRLLKLVPHSTQHDVLQMLGRR